MSGGSVRRGVVSYGPHRSQFVEVWTPERVAPGGPVVLLHGGWWRDRFDLHLMDRLAADLAGRGRMVWNVEYRRTGPDGGGWPGTLEDVVRALRTLGGDPAEVTAVGHSAGGHLALLAARVVGLGAVVAQAPITDPAGCARDGLGEGAVPLFLAGAPDQRTEAYRDASPLAQLPIGCRQLVVHGSTDERVPIEHSRGYAARAAQLGEPVELLEVPGADHFFVLDPTHPSWAHTLSWMVTQDAPTA